MKVESTVPGMVASSRAPDRSWDIMSESLPSWLFGKRLIVTRPLVSAAMASTASFRRTLTECVAGKSIRALKNVTFNEHFFPGHFPHRPVFPGVMILEALAQTAGILAFVTAGVYPDSERPMYFVGIDNARFRKPVEPGDQLILNATLERSMRGIWKFSTLAEVNGEEVASAAMMVAPGTGK